MISVEALSVCYGPKQVLMNIDLTVGRGEVVALIGPNGAGKTTLLRAISGLLRSRSGKVSVNGQAISKLSPVERARTMAVVPQARHLPDGFTVWQTVLLGRTPYLGWLGRPSPEDQEQTAWALERCQLTDLSGRLVQELSGGEQQRVLLARALAQATPILLMDEPTAHLDMQHQTLLLNLVRELAQEADLAILMILHDLNLASLYADRVALLVSGQISASGSAAEVLTPSNLMTAYGVLVQVVPHPNYGTPLILPDGIKPVLHTSGGTARPG